MWYILESEKDAKIYTGFREGVTKEMYLKAITDGSIPDLLFVEDADPGDTFFTPAGRIHAIGKGIVLVEIQQTSDLTYRISDWNRQSSGNVKRELHLDLALEAMDFTAAGKIKVRKEPDLNRTENLVDCEFFTTSLIHFNREIRKDYSNTDSFIVYVCTEGNFTILWEDKMETVAKGETILIPAMIKSLILKPEPEARILEVYVKPATT
jgi:mannose-6-phosphate isomerase